MSTVDRSKPHIWMERGEMGTTVIWLDSGKGQLIPAEVPRAPRHQAVIMRNSRTA